MKMGTHNNQVLVLLLLIFHCHHGNTSTTQIPQSGGGVNQPNSNVPISGNKCQVNPVYTPVPPDDCDYDFTGPADDIFIIDRSESVNQANFHQAKEFVQDFIKKSFVLKKDVNRIVIITYTKQVTEMINFISDPNKGISECELFLPNGLWDMVLFDDAMKNGAELDDALEKARGILSRSDRVNSNIKQRLWVITDFHDTTVTVNPAVAFPGVEFYGVGVGTYNCEEEDQSFYKLITNNPECRYRKIGDWNEALKEYFTPAGEKSGFNRGESVPVTNITLCSNKNCSSGCSCYEFDYPIDGLECITTAHQFAIDDDVWTILAIIFGIVNGLVLVVTIMTFICCRIKRNKPPQKFNTLPTMSRSEGTSTDTMSTLVTDASTYTNTNYLQQNINEYPTLEAQNSTNSIPPNIAPGFMEDSIYVNGDLANMLEAHGIVQTSTTPKNNKTNKKTRSEVKGKGKYKKNVKLHETVSAPANVESHRAISQISQASTTPSSHSYIEPLGDFPVQRPPYSYAYMDTANRRNQQPGYGDLKSPASSHSYEKFNFNRSDQNSQANDFNNELASKLQRMRNRIYGVFTKKAKTSDKKGPLPWNNNNGVQTVSNGTTTNNGVQTYPRNIQDTTLYEQQKELQPTYIDPGTTNTAPPPGKRSNLTNRAPIPIPVQTKDKESTPRYVDSTGQEENKRASSKLGTLKFKNLLYKFTTSQEAVVPTSSNIQYEIGPNGPYCVVDGDKSNMPKPQSFKEIL